MTNKKQKIKFKLVHLPRGKDFDLHNIQRGANTAFCVTRLYGNKGNLLIKGFWAEQQVFLKLLVKMGWRFHYQYSFYFNGKPRFNFNGFWKKNVVILGPSKLMKTSKYFVYNTGNKEHKLSFKRLPLRWIKKFETL